MPVDVVPIVISAITLLVTILYIEYRTNRYEGLEKFSNVASELIEDEDSVEEMKETINALRSLGIAGHNLNVILSNEEKFDGLLTEFAGRVMKSFKASIYGTQSGNVRKKQKAERIVDDAMVKGLQEINPMLGMFLKVTGLQEELEEDPELLGYIMQIVDERGLGNMLANFDSMAIPNQGAGQTRQTNRRDFR